MKYLSFYDSDSAGKEYVESDESGKFHISPEDAARVARRYGRKYANKDAIVAGTDKIELVYGAVMLLRQAVCDLAEKIETNEAMYEPASRAAYFSQCLRRRKAFSEIRKLMHTLERRHGPCPPRVRQQLIRRARKSAWEHYISVPEFGKNYKGDGFTRRRFWFSDHLGQIGSAKSKLRKEYDAWIKARAPRKSKANQ